MMFGTVIEQNVVDRIFAWAELLLSTHRPVASTKQRCWIRCSCRMIRLSSGITHHRPMTMRAEKKERYHRGRDTHQCGMQTRGDVCVRLIDLWLKFGLFSVIGGKLRIGLQHTISSDSQTEGVSIGLIWREETIDITNIMASELPSSFLERRRRTWKSISYRNSQMKTEKVCIASLVKRFLLVCHPLLRVSMRRRTRKYEQS